MGCCVAAALFIYHFVLFRGRIRAWLGRDVEAEGAASAAYWSPGLEPEIAPARPRVPQLRARLAVALACEVLLVGYLGLHWDHLRAEVSIAGAAIGLVEPIRSSIESLADADSASSWCRSITAQSLLPGS